MPLIKSFRAIHPSPEIAGKVAVQVERLSLEEAKSIRQENPLSYINMLVPQVENPFGRGSKQELAFKKINENFEEFRDKGILLQDDSSSVYIYRTIYNDLTHTGIWTLTSIDDYLNNTIRRHEHTREERERALIDYLRQTSIDANPVLITYLPHVGIDQLIGETTRVPPILQFKSDGREHLLWQISDTEKLLRLKNLFAGLSRTYIADGHHRAAAACGYAIERRKLNLKHKGDEEYNFFTSVYMSTNELTIIAFNRLVKDLGGLTGERFLEMIGERFIVEKVSHPFLPAEAKEFTLYFNRQWYGLRPGMPVELTGNPVDELDVTLLQKRLLEPVLGVKDPRTDPRLHFIGGTTQVEELIQLVDGGEFAAAFLLYPTSIEQLLSVADAGEVMPPKSTWFEPKFQAGLLVHKLD